MYVCVYMCVCMYVYLYIYICVCVYMCMRACMYIYMCIYVYIYISCRHICFTNYFVCTIDFLFFNKIISYLILYIHIDLLALLMS